MNPIYDPFCQRDEIGIHRGFKIPRLHGRAGSSPAAGTTFKSINIVKHLWVLFYCLNKPFVVKTPST
jgi:hypothetical protein